MEQKEPVTIVKYDAKKKQLITSTTYPERELELSVGGNKYIVGKNPSYVAEHTVDKENIPILLEYLKEQFAMQNGPYEEAKTQLLQLNPLDDKLCEMLKNIADELKKHDKKEVTRIFTKYGALAQLTENALKKLNLREQIKMREPAVARLKEQVDEVLKVAEMLAKDSK